MPQGSPLSQMMMGPPGGAGMSSAPSPSMAAGPSAAQMGPGPANGDHRAMIKRQLQSALSQLRSAAADAGIPWDEVMSGAEESAPPPMGM